MIDFDRINLTKYEFWFKNTTIYKHRICEARLIKTDKIYDKNWINDYCVLVKVSVQNLFILYSRYFVSNIGFTLILCKSSWLIKIR